MSALRDFAAHIRKQASSAGSAPPAGAAPPADADKEAQDRADSINETIKKKGDLGPQLAKLKYMDMRSLLKLLSKLKQAGTLEDLADVIDIPDRVGAAILTVRGDFEEQWRQLLAKLGKPDREAILERTPPDVKTKVDPDATKPDDDDDRPIVVGLDGVEVQAKLTFKSPLAGSLGETEFTVHVGPGGKLKQFEIDITAIKAKIQKMGALGPMLDLEATLSLNATTDNKLAVKLDPDATRVILGAVQVQAKGEIAAQFKSISILKKVAFKLAVTAGSGGVGAELSVEIPIPSL
jgi:hypothetical protein